MMNLSSLPLNGKGRVEAVAEGEMQRRLLDLGFTPGAWVECLLEAPFGGMRAYRVRGGLVALRKKDAHLIGIKEAQHG